MHSSQFEPLQAVIDASCLRCLLLLDERFPEYRLFRALRLRYVAIHIPQHVWNEVRRRGRKGSQLRKLLDEYPFFKRCTVINEFDARLLYDPRTNPVAKLHRGEAEAIIQARELGVPDILIDERRGSAMARAHSLNPRGILALIKEFRLTGVN